MHLPTPDEVLASALTNWMRYTLQNTPARVRTTSEPRLYGWCDCRNNVVTSAECLVVVEQFDDDGGVLVREMNDDELVAALNEI